MQPEHRRIAAALQNLDADQGGAHAKFALVGGFVSRKQAQQPHIVGFTECVQLGEIQLEVLLARLEQPTHSFW